MHASRWVDDNASHKLQGIPEVVTIWIGNVEDLGASQVFFIACLRDIDVGGLLVDIDGLKDLTNAVDHQR